MVQEGKRAQRRFRSVRVTRPACRPTVAFRSKQARTSADVQGRKSDETEKWENERAALFHGEVDSGFGAAMAFLQHVNSMFGVLSKHLACRRV